MDLERITIIGIRNSVMQRNISPEETLKIVDEYKKLNSIPILDSNLNVTKKALGNCRKIITLF